jgi:hypothetical protein
MLRHARGAVGFAKEVRANGFLTARRSLAPFVGRLCPNGKPAGAGAAENRIGQQEEVDFP